MLSLMSAVDEYEPHVCGRAEPQRRLHRTELHTLNLALSGRTTLKADRRAQCHAETDDPALSGDTTLTHEGDTTLMLKLIWTFEAVSAIPRAILSAIPHIELQKEKQKKNALPTGGGKWEGRPCKWAAHRRY